MYADRKQAGEVLAKALLHYYDDEPVIIALPRGGVPVGYEVALALDAPLDVVVSRKLGAPIEPEFGFGAIALDGRVVDKRSVRMLGLSEEDVEDIAAEQMKEVKRREALFHRSAKALDLEGRTVIVVDDGLATGVTARAAIASLRHRAPKKIVFAAPVCAADSANQLLDYADEVVCIRQPAEFLAVGIWYDNFQQTTDEEVLELLESSRQRSLPTHPSGIEPAATQQESHPGNP